MWGVGCTIELWRGGRWVVRDRLFTQAMEGYSFSCLDGEHSSTSTLALLNGGRRR